MFVQYIGANDWLNDEYPDTVLQSAETVFSELPPDERPPSLHAW